ncbi:hypothetical protein CMUS01_05780 [Colletotrichum musicola]|uniref:Uncharacterized protein n=1 Tax=Colletotrichum musicola TaxID=2175873 RepID=A0A8H6KR29_9PEZI|nr:hypothetical protein CMUS01_05780 [Colletotrichum musicola]
MVALQFFLLTFTCALAQGITVTTWDNSTGCVGGLSRTFIVSPSPSDCLVPDRTGVDGSDCVQPSSQARPISGLTLVLLTNHLASEEESLPHDHTDSTSATLLSYGYEDDQVVYELSAESLHGQEYAKLQDTHDRIRFLKEHGDRRASTSAWETYDDNQVELK